MTAEYANATVALPRHLKLGSHAGKRVRESRDPADKRRKAGRKPVIITLIVLARKV